MADATRQPEPLDSVLSPVAQEELRRLELLARRVVGGLRHGLHRSRMTGVSTDFNHHKSYSLGDPLKHVDWKASARHDRVYVKRYIEDRSLAVRLVLDNSASMRQATEGRPAKFRLACQAAACLAYLVIKERDSAGLATASAAGVDWLPASSRPSQLPAILRTLAAAEPASADGLPTALRVLRDRHETRGIVAVISDLMFDPEPVQRELGSLQAQGHEALLIQVRDPTEEDFPFNRWARFFDLENPRVRHRLDTVLVKRIYREEYQALLTEWRDWTRRRGIHFVSFRTEANVAAVLADYLAFRSRVGRDWR